MKLGELATVRSGLVLSRKQARKGAPVKMRYPLLSFRAIHPNGYIDMEQLDGFDAAEQLSPEYLTQVGDVIIIASYALMDFEDAKQFKPWIVFPDTATNRLVK